MPLGMMFLETAMALPKRQPSIGSIGPECTQRRNDTRKSPSQVAVIMAWRVSLPEWSCSATCSLCEGRRREQARTIMSGRRSPYRIQSLGPPRPDKPATTPALDDPDSSTCSSEVSGKLPFIALVPSNQSQRASVFPCHCQSCDTVILGPPDFNRTTSPVWNWWLMFWCVYPPYSGHSPASLRHLMPPSVFGLSSLGKRVAKAQRQL